MAEAALLASVNESPAINPLDSSTPGLISLSGWPRRSHLSTIHRTTPPMKMAVWMWRALVT